jgi:hypothetical protein
LHANAAKLQRGGMIVLGVYALTAGIDTGKFGEAWKGFAIYFITRYK